MEIIQGASVKFAGAPPVNGFIIFSPIHRTVKMFITYFVVGVIGTVAAGGIIAYFVNKNKQKADHEEEGRRILQVMVEKASEDVGEPEENAEVIFSGGNSTENSDSKE